MNNRRSSAVLRCTTLAIFVIGLTLFAQQDVASAQTTNGTATAFNTSGSLETQCSSQAGLLSLIQSTVAGQGPAGNATSLGFALDVPANLTNAAAVQEIAQVKCLFSCARCGVDVTNSCARCMLSLSACTYALYLLHAVLIVIVHVACKKFFVYSCCLQLGCHHHPPSGESLCNWLCFV